MEAPRRQRSRAALDAIARHCGSGLHGSDVFARLPGQLGEVVPFRTGGWFRLDPQTMLPMPGLLLHASHDRAAEVIHNEYFEDDFVKFRDLAREVVPAQSLWKATGGEPERSVRYRSTLSDLGYGDELRMVFRSGGAVWGAACVARAAGDPPFSAADISFAARLCEPVARGLRLSHLLRGDGPADPAPPGVIILRDDASIASQTPAARHWLSQLPADQARGLDLPAAILSAVSEARALDAVRPGSGAVTGRLRTASGGWLRLHAARMASEDAGETGQTAVILEPARPAELSPLVLDLHELTDRERQVTQLLLRGLPTAEIAQALFISRHTLSDHMKSIFGKLGVSSRPELTALLLDRAPAIR